MVDKEKEPCRNKALNDWNSNKRKGGYLYE